MLLTGCYLDQHRHSAIVLRIKNGVVTYLTMNVTKPSHYQGAVSYEVIEQKVSLCSASDTNFARQFEVYLHNYPVLRAIKIFWRSGLQVSEDAEKAIRIFLLANKTKKTAKA
jgi:hypothetical protein